MFSEPCKRFLVSINPLSWVSKLSNVINNSCFWDSGISWTCCNISGVNKFGDKPIAHVSTCGVIGIQFKDKHWKDIKKGITTLVEFPKNHR